MLYLARKHNNGDAVRKKTRHEEQPKMVANSQVIPTGLLQGAYRAATALLTKRTAIKKCCADCMHRDACMSTLALSRKCLRSGSHSTVTWVPSIYCTLRFILTNKNTFSWRKRHQTGLKSDRLVVRHHAEYTVAFLPPRICRKGQMLLSSEEHQRRRFRNLFLAPQILSSAGEASKRCKMLLLLPSSAA